MIFYHTQALSPRYISMFALFIKVNSSRAYFSPYSYFTNVLFSLIPGTYSDRWVSNDFINAWRHRSSNTTFLPLILPRMYMNSKMKLRLKNFYMFELKFCGRLMCLSNNLGAWRVGGKDWRFFFLLNAFINTRCLHETGKAEFLINKPYLYNSCTLSVSVMWTNKTMWVGTKHLVILSRISDLSIFHFAWISSYLRINKTLILQETPARFEYLLLNKT